jgi:phosphomevalonate kinase
MSVMAEPAGPLSISIPGKVMLSGEYAVLYGGAATLIHAPRQLHIERIVAEPAPGYPPAAHAARRIRIRELEEYERQHGLPHYSQNADEFFAEDHEGRRTKLGLGLSAAEAVGAVAMRFYVAGLEWTQHRALVMQYALAAHREVSGGGSGADVAACAGAGAVECALRDGVLCVTPLAGEARPGVPLALYWSGVAADTRRLVGIFQRWVSGAERAVDHPIPGADDIYVAQQQSRTQNSLDAPPIPAAVAGADSAGLLPELVSAADELAPAWFDAPPGELFALLDRFEGALGACVVASGLPHTLAVHARLSAWARRHGGRAKPTGAGGGDMVLLIGDLPLAQLQGLVIPLG